MKVFLSWSGEVSRRVALALERWLPYVIQEIEPFSSADIPAGEKWHEILADKLKDAHYGIICITPYNTHKAWMNFEAGALSKALTVTSVVPFLFHVESDELSDGPLAQFQHATYRKDDVFKLLQGINRRLDKPLEADLLENTFDKWWRELDDQLQTISLASDETRAYYQWLYTREDALQSFRNSEGYGSAWIATTDPGKYLSRDMKDLVQAECKLGKQFRYFLPRADDYEPELKGLTQSFPGVFSFKFFSEQRFETQATSDYIMFNPDGGGDLKVLVKIPLSEHVHSEFWFKAADRSGRSFVNRFRDLWDEDEAKATS